MAPIATMFQKGGIFYQNYYLKKNDIPQLTYIIGILKYYQTPVNRPPLPPLFSIRHKKVIVTFFLECKKINFKIPWPGYFCKLCYFFKALVFECHICLFQAKFLSCAIFVSCNFFAMVSRGAFFVECILSDTAVFVLLFLLNVFYLILLFLFCYSYVHNEYYLGLPLCYYLLFYQ